MPGHVQLGLHLVVLGVAGNLAAVKIVGPEVVLVESRVRAKVPRSGGSDTECGEIEDESARCAVQCSILLTGERTSRHETARAAKSESCTGHRQRGE